jgi:hypothetical protein
VIEQAEVLEDHADATAQMRQFGARDAGAILAEDGDQSACRLQRHEQQAQQCRLAGPRRSAQELERALRDVQGNVAEDFRTHAIAEADIFETNQFRRPEIAGGNEPACSGVRPSAGMVNRRLIPDLFRRVTGSPVGKH